MNYLESSKSGCLYSRFRHFFSRPVEGIYQWGLLLVVSLVVAGLYSQTLGGGFVFDDLRLIPNNKLIQIDALSLDNITKIMSTTRPIAMLTFAINYYFHQLDVPAYHVTNIVIHIVTGIILYFFLKHIFKLPAVKKQYGESKYLPFVSAMIWLIHPIQTQSVSYIIQRMNCMAALFFILGMLFYVKARSAKSLLSQGFLFFGCVVSGVLALGSKENAATLPFFIFLYEWFFIQDLRRKWLARSVVGLVLLVLVVAGVLYFNQQIIPWGLLEKGYEPYRFTMYQRVLTEFNVVILYISLLLFPSPGRLNLDYDFPVSSSLIEPVSTLFSFGGIFLMVALAIYYARNQRLLSFCVLWFFGNLVIESSVIPLDLVFEHRVYLPSMMGLVALVLLCVNVIRSQRGRLILCCLVVVICSLWTYQRNMVWADPIALFVDSALKMPGNPRPAYNVACEYAKRGEAKEAVKWLKISVSNKIFNRWDLVRRDHDLDSIRDSSEFKEFYNVYVPKRKKIEKK